MCVCACTCAYVWVCVCWTSAQAGAGASINVCASTGVHGKRCCPYFSVVSVPDSSDTLAPTQVICCDVCLFPSKVKDVLPNCFGNLFKRLCSQDEDEDEGEGDGEVREETGRR